MPFRVKQMANVVALRISPEHYAFVLLSRSEKGHAYTPQQWALRYGLAAVINASMYLPDQVTSTGYMRNGGHINNSTINAQFGSFFVAGAQKPGVPAATLLDRKYDDWKEQIQKYSLVIQNFRMISATGKALWPKVGREFSIAAIANDTKGNILFIHCSTPFTVHRFSKLLLDLPLDVHKAMYVEGGPQASLYVASEEKSLFWSGRHVGDFWNGVGMQWALPNVLGIVKRK